MSKKTNSNVNNVYLPHNDRISIEQCIKVYERVVKNSPSGGASKRLNELYKKRYENRRWEHYDRSKK